MSQEELAASLAEAAGKQQTISLGGGFTKDAVGGPVAPADVTISTRAMVRVLQYEPSDLTISVEAGMRLHDLQLLLARNRQMIPLDPPFAATGTVGGTVAANLSGPRRRLYGAARDLVIGLTFATLEGKLIQSGGMVVKNVAGLDMGKLMIGSYGTLGAIASLNFKLLPLPDLTQTAVFSFPTVAAALAKRDEIIQGVFQPAAIDYLNVAGSAALKRQGHLLLVQIGGSEALFRRVQTEFTDAEFLTGEAEAELWRAIREYCPEFLATQPEGAIVRVSTTLGGIRGLSETASVPLLSRAANGVSYLCFNSAASAASWVSTAPPGAVIEWAPVSHKENLVQWPAPGTDFEMMKKIKKMFDPQQILNRGRLYGRL